jgi:plasmid stabilization system protein ParE
MKQVFSSVFEGDFAELVAYFQDNAGSDLSVRFENQICELIEWLMRHPELGRLRKDLKPVGIRSFGVPDFRNYLLFYQIKGGDLVLLRLRYGGMDLPTLLNR